MSARIRGSSSSPIGRVQQSALSPAIEVVAGAAVDDVAVDAEAGRVDVVERAGDVRAADEDVVAGLAVDDVVALLAEDDVVAGAGVDQVVAGAGRREDVRRDEVERAAEADADAVQRIVRVVRCGRSRTRPCPGLRR